MTKKEITDTLRLLTGLATYFRQELPEAVLEIYLNTLSERDYDEVQDAIRHFFEKGIKMPLLSDFNDFFILKGINIDALYEIKWERLMKIIGKCSSYISWTDNDPAFRRAVEGIGYDAVCQATEQEIKWIKKDFIKIYRSFACLPKGSYKVKDYFIGSHEADNRYFDSIPTSRKVTYSGDKILFLDSDNKFSQIPTDKICSFLTNNETMELDYDNMPF